MTPTGVTGAGRLTRRVGEQSYARNGANADTPLPLGEARLGIVRDSLNGLTNAIRQDSKIEWAHLRIGLFMPRAGSVVV